MRAGNFARSLFFVSIFALNQSTFAQSATPSANPPSQAAAQTAAPATQQQPAPVERSGQTPPPTDEITPLYRRDPAATITATARAVVLDVTVVDAKGKPVTGLKPDDFQVLEDAAVQKVDSFTAHTPADPAIAATQLQQAKLPPNTFTDYLPANNSNALTVILLDAANTPPASQAYARDQLIKYMKTVPAGYPIAIFQRDTRLHLLQGFTADPDVLLAAVEGARDMVRLPLVPPYIRGDVGTRYRLDTLQDAMRSIARYLTAFPGRKNLVWFTGNIPGSYWDISSPFPEIEDYQEELSSASETLALSRVSLYPVDARGLESDPAFSAEHRGPPSLGSTSAFGTRRFFDHSAMDQMAQETGGVAFYNTNGLKQALQRVVDTGSFYYTIAYTPTNKNWDGTYRKIHIDLASDLGDLHVQYRQGYYSRPPSVAQVHKAQRRKQTAPAPAPAPAQAQALAVVPSGERGSFPQNMQLGAVAPTELTFELSVSPGTEVQRLAKGAEPADGTLPEKGIASKPLREMHLLYAVDSRGVKFTKNPDGTEHAEIEFVALLYNDQGEMQNSVLNTTEMNLKPDVYATVAKGGFKMKQDIAVPDKGNYFLRVGVHDKTNDRAGVLEVPLENIELGVAGAGQTLAP